MRARGGAGHGSAASGEARRGSPSLASLAGSRSVGVAASRSASLGDAVSAATAFYPLRRDREAELLLQRAADGASHRMRLPVGFRDDLVDGDAILALQESDRASVNRAACATTLNRSGRLGPLPRAMRCACNPATVGRGLERTAWKSRTHYGF